MKVKRILVTGAAGFIGYHAALALVQRGDFVIGIDHYNAYYDTNLKWARTAELKKKGITVVKGDLSEEGILKKLVIEHKITHILHLAAQAGVRYSLTHPEIYIQSNITGFLNVLEVCRAFPSIPLIYASSSSVYGLNSTIPFTETDRTDHQASLYGVTKKTNELMAHSYHHLFGLSVTGLRFFTVYGPWGRPDMAYFSFAEAILENRPIQLFNYGHMQRDFTYIDDIVEGILAAIDRQEKCAIYNLGNHHPEQLGYLVELLEEKLGKKAQKEWVEHQAGDVLSTYASIEESREKLNFVPKVSLSEGISRFVEWYSTYRKK